MYLPDNRPVFGSDLSDLGRRLGYTGADMRWLFGMSGPDWFETIGALRPRIVKDPARAILVRLLDESPELSPIAPKPNPKWIFDTLREIHGPEITKKRFGLAFGRHASAGRRWIEEGAPPDPSAERLMEIWCWTLAQGKGSIFLHLEYLAETEAKARGIVDLRRGGSWNRPVPPEILARRRYAAQKRRTCFNRPRRHSGHLDRPA